MQKNNNLANSVYNIANTLLNSFHSIEQQAAIEAKKEQLLNENPNAIRAIYPCIIEEAFSKTMDNYRKYVAQYNTKTTQENQEIDKWNCSISAYGEMSEAEQTFTVLFLRKYAALNAREFNQKVEEYFQERNIILEKRKIPTIKYASELIFTAFLSAYNAQLINHNSELMKLGVAVEKPIPNIKINSWFITQMKRNGVQSLNICSKSIRNHRDRLHEAGILTGRLFKGTKSAVEFQINPEILTVIDFKTNKLLNTEKQQVNPDKGKILPDNDVTTGTFKKEIERKENGTTDFLINTSSGKALTVVYFGTGTPVRKVENSKHGEAAENVNFSEKLLATIENEQLLAEKLAANQYCNYRSIDIRLLDHEAHNGTLSNEEFIQVIIQDFFKASNKIFANHPSVYTGSWKIAINTYLKSKFRLFNGKPMQKVNLIDDIQELRWRLEFARKWFLQNPTVNPLYPNDYFDLARTKSYEIGFEYTREKFKAHLKKLERLGQQKVKAEAKAKRRANTYKYNAKVNQFLDNKITWEQLKKYVYDNLPKEFKQNLSAQVNKLLNERNQLQQNKQLEEKTIKVTYNINEFLC